MNLRWWRILRPPAAVSLPAAGAPPEPAVPPPGPLTWTMSTYYAECGCIHFLDHRNHRRVIHQCRGHARMRVEFNVREWNERLNQS